MPAVNSDYDQYASNMRMQSILRSGMSGAQGRSSNPIARGSRGVTGGGATPAGAAGSPFSQSEYPVAPAGTPLGRFIQDMSGQPQKNADIMGRNAQAVQGQYEQAVQDFHDALPQAGNDPRRALLAAFTAHPEHFTNEEVFQKLIANAGALAGPAQQPHDVPPGGSLVGPDGKVIFQSPNKPVDVRAGGSLVNPDTGAVIANVPSEAGAKAKSWTVDDARLLQGTGTILDNIDSLKKNAGATGPVSGKLREVGAKYLGVGDEAKAYEGTLDTIRSQITGLAGNARYKAQLENLLTTLPTQGQSEDYNRTQSIPNLQLQARQFYADRIAEMQESGKPIPQSFLDAAKRYSATPEYMTSLQGAMNRARSGQTTADDLKILAGEASAARSANGDTVYTGNIPFDVVQSGLQSARKQGLIDDSRWAKLVQAFPDIANAQQQQGNAPAQPAAQPTPPPAAPTPGQ